MEIFHNISGVDEFTNVGIIFEKGQKMFPVMVPGSNRHGVFLAPISLPVSCGSRHEAVGPLVFIAFFLSKCLIDKLQVRHKSYLIFLTHIAQTIADLMHNAGLQFSTGKDVGNSFWKTFQSIHAS
jgi:hypothetical protein